MPTSFYITIFGILFNVLGAFIALKKNAFRYHNTHMKRFYLENETTYIPFNK